MKNPAPFEKHLGAFRKFLDGIRECLAPHPPHLPLILFLLLIPLSVFIPGTFTDWLLGEEWGWGEAAITLLLIYQNKMGLGGVERDSPTNEGRVS